MGPDAAAKCRPLVRNLLLYDVTAAAINFFPCL